MSTSSSKSHEAPEQLSSPVAKSILAGLTEKLVDAASLLVLVTAALYFWGFIYFSEFCEHLGVSFQGITLPPEEYIIVSWATVLFLLSLIAAALMLVQLFLEIVENVVRIFPKLAGRKDAPDGPSASLPFYKIGMMMFFATGVLIGGAKFMIIQAREHADNALRRQTAIVIRDAEGRAIEGRFFFLRDFGSALLVAELDADGRRTTAHRLFKASSYSGYSLSISEKPALKP